MLWSLVLPFFITVVGLTLAVVVSTVLAPKIRWRRLPLFAYATLMAMVAFIPSCTVVMKVTNAVRLGVARYENYDAIWDRRFKRWLPEDATDIVLHKHIGGYDARFKIDRESLNAWFDRCWANAREKAAPREEPKLDMSFDPSRLENNFGDIGDSGPRNGRWVKYEGPRRLNWAGATTWFDENSGVAYQDVGFW